MKVIRILKETVMSAGFVVRTELWDTGLAEKPTAMRSAYTPSGEYIGSPADARHLVIMRGIRPQLRKSTSNVCSIGYCPTEKKWYGWSHRAIYGFSVGSVVRKGSTISKKHGGPYRVGFRVKTLEQAREMAEAFAESVG